MTDGMDAIICQLAVDLHPLVPCIRTLNVWPNAAIGGGKHDHTCQNKNQTLRRAQFTFGTGTVNETDIERPDAAEEYIPCQKSKGNDYQINGEGVEAGGVIKKACI